MFRLTRSCAQLVPIIIMLMLSWQNIAAPISEQLLEKGAEQMEIERESDEIKEVSPEIVDLDRVFAEDQVIWAVDLVVCFVVFPHLYLVYLAAPASPPELL
ncbi:MAG: hypothetical protein A3D92_21910 [Bacteroidetes bacterium RIFCSPHIGHO2_02_FULL_44_7]|nr:MAG: hypothetical protein A3D92_21910 [Bacteroidetes bacterium RIFCSPHIGHO2_02_FULL_44_7]